MATRETPLQKAQGIEDWNRHVLYGLADEQPAATKALDDLIRAVEKRCAEQVRAAGHNQAADSIDPDALEADPEELRSSLRARWGS